MYKNPGLVTQPLCANLLIVLLLCFSVSPLHAAPVSIQNSGMTLNADLQIPDGNSLNKGVVLIVHGTLAHYGMEIISHLQALLNEQGFNSLAINLSLGLSNRQGPYDCATPHRHRHTDALDEIKLWLRWLKEQGAGPITLLGHSRGGNQVAWYAAEHPGDAKSLVLLAPMTWDKVRTEHNYQTRFGVSLNELLAEARRLKPQDLLEKIGFIYCKETTASAAAILNYYTDNPMRNTPTLLSKIKIPTLIISGSNDQVVPDIAIQSKPMLDDNTQLYEVEGAGHFFQDLYLDDAVEKINEFLTHTP